METRQLTSVRPEGIRELPIVAGHLALDFANTVDDPHGPERFDHVIDYAGLLEWSLRVGVLTDQAAATLRRTSEAHPRRAAAVVRRAASLRDALNETFGARFDDAPPTAGWQQLRPFVAKAIQQAQVGTDQLNRTWDFSDLESMLWPVAESSYTLLTGPLVARLKRCAGCPWLFLDQSKNGSRRWCSMELCGTDQKIRRYVATRRSTRSTPSGH
jgi:predicted RNA-binding Zn ribbon-like protein